MKIIFNDATEISIQKVTQEGDYLNVLSLVSPETLREYFCDPVKTKKMAVVERGQTIATHEGYTTFYRTEAYTGGIYGVVMYKTIQDNLLIQEQLIPGEGTESLYTVIDETHAGTQEDPIPYAGNMALENGKYYIQDGVIYLCNRDTEIPVYQPLSDLVGLYVTVAG